MSRFLFCVTPIPGHLNIFMSVAKAVQARGHEVAFYTGNRAQTLLDGEGFDFFSFEHFDGDRAWNAWRALEARESIAFHAPAKLYHIFRDCVVRPIPDQVSDLNSIIRTWRPDALITDFVCWGPFLVLWETTGLPVALLSTGLGCRMGGSFPGAAASSGPGLPAAGNFVARSLAWAIHLAATGIRREVNRIRASHGLPPMGCSVDDFMWRLPLYIVPNVPEFDFRTIQPPSVHYVGPCVWNWHSRSAATPWLDELASDRPWVHVTEGTIHYRDPLVLRAAAQGLACQPVQAILTTGQDRDPAELDLGPIAPNVRVERWVSHGDLLPRCAAVVTTGGAGTVMSALQAGVPMVVVPTASGAAWDKPMNARRVVAAGVGLSLRPRQCTPARLRAAVERILTEPSFREQARRLARRLAEAPGPPRAAELLESLSLSARPGATPDRTAPSPCYMGN